MTSDAPVAPARPVELSRHGDVRVDPYYWLREREDPEVIAYLEAENAYTDRVLAPTRPLQEQIFGEIRGRVQETDVSPPARKGAWEYFTRTFEGSQYALHGRRPTGTPDGVDETVLLDENELATGLDYFSLGGLALSPDQARLAYSFDDDGGELHTLRFRDIATGTDLPDVIDGVYYGLAWANDGVTIFYVRPDDAMRPFQVWRHTLGRADDALVFEEHDERFFLSVGRARSGKAILISSDSKLTSESHLLNPDDPAAAPRVVEPRTDELEYDVEHHVGADGAASLFILTNADGATNFKIVRAPVDAPGRAGWTEVVPHRHDVKLDGVDAFADFLVLSERTGGLEQLRIVGVTDPTLDRVLTMDDPAYSTWTADNLEFETDTFRFGYTSLVSPTTAFDEVATGDRRLVKRTPVLGGFDPADYTSARLWATAPDGTRVPMSVVHRRDTPIDGTAPALLYGYGSYESSIDPTFSSIRLSLLDRGFVFAIAHIRGGGELGRPWYEHGRLREKRNTFTDFIACAEHLCAERYTAPDRLGARGGSAGGLLMGAITNLRPDLFRAVVAEVPFVDVVTTMQDVDLPLTVTEWEEWGNPLDDPDDYAYMKSYSPYDNVQARDYPAMLVTAGLNDPRVSYWEPAKYVARMRATRTNDRTLILKTEMGAGHGGPSGRYDAWKDEAMTLAFLITELGGEAGMTMSVPVGGLEGAATLVSGGGSGIGLGIARRFVADGAHVTICGRSEARLVGAAEQLRATASNGATVRHVVADVTEEDQIAAAVAAAAETTGTLDGVVACAGGSETLGPITHMDTAAWRRTIDLNITGTMLTIKHAAAVMTKAGRGSIVGISSIASSNVHPWFGAYGPGKAGIDHVCQLAALELGASGVRVNSIRPGLVDTDLVGFVTAGGDVLDDYLACMPIARVGTVEDIAAMARFLVGPESTWLTGQAINVDGGHSLTRGPDYRAIVEPIYGADALRGIVDLDSGVTDPP